VRHDKAGARSYIFSAMTNDAKPNAKPQLNPLLKLVLDLGPLVLFFVANSHYGIFAATATFMVAAKMP